MNAVCCAGWHLGVFKQVSMPSQPECITHKLSKELSKKKILEGLYILYPQYHSILVEEGEYDFFGFCLKKGIF